jgi:dTDP-4-dehydrorhamnose reductase
VKVLVTGAGGLLGTALVPRLFAANHEVVALHRLQLDVTDEEAVRQRVTDEHPEVVIHCAAYTGVDAAEADPGEAFRVNAQSTNQLAEVCGELGIRLVYPSTDYIFPGDAERPYLPTDTPRPLNVYGSSKLAGEQAAATSPGFLVVRTGWLYGKGGSNFVEAITAVAAEKGMVEVVNDQIGRPTWSVSVAETLLALVEGGAAGTFHATDVGRPVSWYDVAREVFARRGVDVPVAPIASAALARPALRPAYSVLDCAATQDFLGGPLRDWRESLRLYLESVE